VKFFVSFDQAKRKNSIELFSLYFSRYNNPYISQTHYNPEQQHHNGFNLRFINKRILRTFRRVDEIRWNTTDFTIKTYNS
jgi:hypothetical protein